MVSSSRGCLWLSQRKRTQLVHLFIVQRTGGKFGTRCILFSVFENISSQTFEFSAVGGAKPSHHRPQNIFEMKKSCQCPLLRGTRRYTPLSWVYWVQGTHRHIASREAPLGGTRPSTGSKEHTSTWAPFGGGELLHRFVCGFLKQEERSVSIFS